MLKKHFTIFFLLGIFFTTVSCTNTFASSNLEISNKFFSFTMPDETKGTYDIEKEGSGIFILEKVSHKANVGGFAFGLRLFKNPNEYAKMPGNKKIGELTDRNGTLYDMVLMRPTEIQYVDRKEVQENYDKLYESANNLEIKGVNGSKYAKGKGIKGEELYNDILEKYKKMSVKKWNSYQEFLKEDINSIFYDFQKSKKNNWNKVGYTYYDINSDGIEELLIGKITKGKSKGMIYDIYTMVNRVPKRIPHSSSSKDNLFICNSSFLCNNYIYNKKEGGMTVSFIEENSIIRAMQILFYYNKNEKTPWNFRYYSDKDWRSVSKKDYYDKIKAYQDYERFDFTPLKNN